MERQEVCAMCMIDLSAAFDTANHQILLDVLRIKFGVEDTGLSWFSTYLRSISCTVNVEDNYLKFTVPQGSLCGPVLYSAYASTLQEMVPSHLYINSFADDHSFKNSFKASSREDKLYTIRNLENCTRDVKVRMDKNCLKMNDHKTDSFFLGQSFNFPSVLQKALMLTDVLYPKVK